MCDSDDDFLAIAAVLEDVGGVGAGGFGGGGLGYGVAGGADGLVDVAHGWGVRG